MRAVILTGTFVIAWFIALLGLLPMGAGSRDPETGSPENPRIVFKMVVATLLASASWAIVYALVLAGIIDI